MPELNLTDIILIIVIAAAVAAAVIFTLRRKKKGGGCSCGCAGCAYSGNCSKKETDRMK